MRPSEGDPQVISRPLRVTVREENRGREVSSLACPVRDCAGLRWCQKTERHVRFEAKVRALACLSCLVVPVVPVVPGRRAPPRVSDEAATSQPWNHPCISIATWAPTPGVWYGMKIFAAFSGLLGWGRNASSPISACISWCSWRGNERRNHVVAFTWVV